jgi:DNA repair and recombination protein RAD54B
MSSFNSISDTILYNNMFEQYDANPPEKEPENEDDSEIDDGGPGLAKIVKSKRKPKSADSDEDMPDRVLDSADEGDDSDNGDAPVSKKKKKKAVIPANSRSDLSQDRKQYSLAKIAAAGGTGRVMFAFEKISSSKILSEKEPQGVESDADL